MAETLEGLKELNAKLGELGRRTGTKTLRSAVLKATTPVLRQMPSKAPIGTRAHRTHKGRLVAPGFLRRSLRRRTRVNKSAGSVSVVIGVRSEAFYGISFFDQGPHTITKRRQQTTTKARGHVGTRRRHINIKPYTLSRRPFLQSVFIANRRVMEQELTRQLRAQIEKAARGR